MEATSPVAESLQISSEHCYERVRQRLIRTLDVDGQCVGIARRLDQKADVTLRVECASIKCCSEVNRLDQFDARIQADRLEGLLDAQTRECYTEAISIFEREQIYQWKM